MSLTQALFLGVLQGLTEFLPVSSSGHLVLAELLLNFHVDPTDMLGFNVLLHAGSLVALLLVYARTWYTLLMAPFRRDKKNSIMLILLIVATIPGAVAGYFLEATIAMYTQTLLAVGIALAGTACILILGEIQPQRSRSSWHRLLHRGEQKAEPLTIRSAIFIGAAQAIALIPGFSRSGFTISAGRMMGLERKQALDFSFLMAAPIIAGASVLSAINLLTGGLHVPPADLTIPAVIASFATSLFAIVFLRAFVVSRSLAWFSPYLLIASITAIWVALS